MDYDKIAANGKKNDWINDIYFPIIIDCFGVYNWEGESQVYKQCYLDFLEADIYSWFI